MRSDPAPVALVTGAARGIGAATVARLLCDGYAVTALDSCAGDSDGLLRYPLATRTDLDAVAALDPDRVLAIQADVRDPASRVRSVGGTGQRYGHLDGAVAAAGALAGGAPLWETPLELFDLMLDVNAKGVWNTAVAAVPAMLTGPDPSRARFVAVVSAAGRHGLFRLAAYTAAKHAAIGIVRGLSADLAGTGVTAVAVCPGSTRTDMLDATADIYRVDVDELTARQDLRRALEPAEIAGAMIFNVTRRKAVKGPAPSERAASSSERSKPTRLAVTVAMTNGQVTRI